ncbi:MAG: AraC family transcriptional regulator [Fluviicoccus sp.]|uniref:AraC family transcriptional regulator n=1 Tax=Fluviicoccus sp. TaxID=2003552 RepID=UPI0027199EB3|nr:AraC family transcriptional regulator [Fluviicoccus sp.]MDO8329617.1 AraC family transcriptional regulator [Fluviicoccus sp.]
MNTHQQNTGRAAGIITGIMQVPLAITSGNHAKSKGQQSCMRTVPVEFGRIVLQWAAENGHDMSDYLEGLDIPSALLNMEDTRIPVNVHYKLVQRAISLNGSIDGLGYELGMRIGLTTHALTGYALLSQLTLREAIRFGVEYSPLVIPIYRGEFMEGADQASIVIRLDFTPEAAMQRYFYDMALTAVWKGLRNLIGGVWPDVELWFEYPEPAYFSEYSDQLPKCRFGMGSNRLCFPAYQLDRKIHTGDPVMARLMAGKFQDQRATQRAEKPIVDLVRRELVSDGNGYPDMENVSRRLFMSGRTLKRRLQQAESSFQQLLDEARHADASRLLSASTMTIEEVATWVGYGDPSNFSNAFRRWTGMTPSAFRISLNNN